MGVERGGLMLIFDRKPELILDRWGGVVGVDAMVRLLAANGRELRIDPHRIIVNPPTVPRANLTYVDGPELDKDGKPVKIRVVGAPDPAAAWEEAVWDSVETVPNAKGWRTRGTVTTVYAEVPGGEGTCRSFNATYAIARTGGTLLAVANHVIGQFNDYRCYESFVIFNTSAIPDTDVVSDVIASFDGSSDTSTTDFDVKLAASSYNGGAVTGGDWVDGSTLSGLTELASWSTAGYSAGYNDFTSAGAVFNSAINKTGNTALILFSSRHAAGTTPTGSEYVTFTDADAAGTTSDAKLAITHASGGSMPPLLGGSYRRLNVWHKIRR